MKIALKQNELDYFLHHIPAMLDDQEQVCIQAGHRQVYHLSLDERTAEKIVEVCMMRFADAGLQANFELNAEGLLLENMVDRFHSPL